MCPMSHLFTVIIHRMYLACPLIFTLWWTLGHTPYPVSKATLGPSFRSSVGLAGSSKLRSSGGGSGWRINVWWTIGGDDFHTGERREDCRGIKEEVFGMNGFASCTILKCKACLLSACFNTHNMYVFTHIVPEHNSHTLRRNLLLGDLIKHLRWFPHKCLQD